MKKAVISVALVVCSGINAVQALDLSDVTISPAYTINTIQIVGPTNGLLLVTANDNKNCVYLSNQNVDTKTVLAELLTAKSAGFKVQFTTFGGYPYGGAWGKYMTNKVLNYSALPFSNALWCQEANGVIVE